MPHNLSRRLLLATALAATALRPAFASPLRLDQRALLDLLRRPGHVGFMRHAFAPFEGAPRETGRRAETLGPCETQRNLDDTGRADARRIGALFRSEGIVFEHVFTSKWCRCRETAELIVGGPVENLPLINSYFSDPDKATKGPAQLAALKTYLGSTLAPAARALMVTHGSLISDLSGIDTGETEIVVVEPRHPGGLRIVGHGIL